MKNMKSHSYILFTISLIESSGLLGQVGSPNLFYWLSVAHVPGAGINDGKASIISRDISGGKWREHAQKVSVEQSNRVIELLEGLGFPDRLPVVKGVVDTSEGWSHISFQIGYEQRHSHLEIAMQCSGFEDKDAVQLRELFRYLFSLADYEEYSWSIYGTA
jgi:hypothetical protein